MLVAVPEHSSTSDRRPSETESPVSRNGKGQDLIPRNGKGQRVDIPLKFSRNLVGGINGRKYCNNYHLLGECPYYGENGCRHEHGDRLKGAQLNTLCYIARLTPCKAGLACDDPECFWGHKCVHGSCNVVGCRFSSDMHNVDTKVAKPLNVLGDRNPSHRRSATRNQQKNAVSLGSWYFQGYAN